MRWSMRTMVGASVMAAAAILPLGATAHATSGATADATPADSDAAAAGWKRSSRFTSYAACNRVRSQMVSLGYATQPCYLIDYPPGQTTPGLPAEGWYYNIWK